MDTGYKKYLGPGLPMTFLLSAREYYSSAKIARGGTPRIVMSKLQTRISWNHNLISDSGKYVFISSSLSPGRQQGPHSLLKIQTDSGAHPASCTTDTGSFPGVKAAGAWCWPHTPSGAEVKKELSSTSTHPMGPPGPVTGFPLYLTMRMGTQYHLVAGLRTWAPINPLPHSSSWLIV
jgi:hypothetical protein